MKKFLLIFVLFFLVGCHKPADITPPEPLQEVTSVTINYNDQPVSSGILRVDISAKSITVTTTVVKTELASGDVTFTSSDSNIATIDNGVITLHKTGETVITAQAGGKTHDVVLIVEDLFSQTGTYNINVEGGKASAQDATPGEYITLEAQIPEHKTFVRWEFRIGGTLSSIWTNGNVIMMPASDLDIKAIYEDKLYTLNVINATVIGEEFEEEIDDVRVYKFAYDTEIRLKADEEPENKMFVGFDYQTKKNRRGELGETTLEPFTMPDETLTIWAVYSEKSDLGFPTAASSAPYSNASKGFKLITNGVPANEAADPDLRGMSGYRFAIDSSVQAVPEDDYSVENILGSNLSNGEKGSYTLRAVFKNHHPTLPISVEFYASYHGAITTTGTVLVPANGTVTKYFLASLGFNNPWMSLVVRKPTNLTSGDVIKLDMVVEKAPTYPDGDKQFEISGLAQWVHIDPYTQSNWAKEKTVNNNLGMSIIAAYAQDIKENGFIVTKIKNLPETPSKIYFRVINATKYVGTYRFVISKTNNPLSAEDIVSTHEFELQPFGVSLFAIDITSEAQYFGIVKHVADGTGLYGHTFVLQMAYNNIFNVME